MAHVFNEYILWLANVCHSHDFVVQTTSFATKAVLKTRGSNVLTGEATYDDIARGRLQCHYVFVNRAFGQISRFHPLFQYRSWEGVFFAVCNGIDWQKATMPPQPENRSRHRIVWCSIIVYRHRYTVIKPMPRVSSLRSTKGRTVYLPAGVLSRTLVYSQESHHEHLH